MRPKAEWAIDSEAMRAKDNIEISAVKIDNGSMV